MKLRWASKRVLDPLERFSEIVFGLVMVLSFTCALSVAEAGEETVHEMLVGAIGCNLAWGIIDAAFYLIACLTEPSRQSLLLRRVQSSDDPAEVNRTLTEAIPARIAEALRDDDFARIRVHLCQTPPEDRARLTGENWLGALGVFLLVFLSTFPVVIPFMLSAEPHVALRVSNGIAIALLFAAGYMLAEFAGLRRIRTGLAMVAIGAALVAVALALGG